MYANRRCNDLVKGENDLEIKLGSKVRVNKIAGSFGMQQSDVEGWTGTLIS